MKMIPSIQALNQQAKKYPFIQPHSGQQLFVLPDAKSHTVKEMDLADLFYFKDVSKNLKNFHLDLNRDKVNWLNIRTMKIACTEPNILQIQYDYQGSYH